MKKSRNRSSIQEQTVNAILNSNFNGSIVVSQRVGKTKVIIDALKFFLKTNTKYKVLWVTPSQKLRDIDIPQEFVKWRAKGLLRKTDIICWSSLNKIDKEYDVIILDVRRV